MEPKVKSPNSQSDEILEEVSSPTVHEKYLAFVRRENKDKTVWFVLALVLQGTLILPVPAVLLFYYNAPIYVLVITLLTYFPNLITAMTGASLRVTLAIFIASLLINWGMLLYYVL
jgi:hypothetical protein